MTDNQIVQDEGGLWKYFAPMLHIDDDDLDPYQYRLLGHYRRVCGVNGDCTESIRKTADKTRMSTGKVSTVRRELVKLGRIRVEEKPDGIRVTLRDCWVENITRYQSCSPDEQSDEDETRSPHEQERSPDEQPVHHMNGGVHLVKQRTIKKNNQTRTTKNKTNRAASVKKSAKPPPDDCLTPSVETKKEPSVQLLEEAGVHPTVAQTFSAVPVEAIKGLITIVDEKAMAGQLTKTRQAYLVGALQQLQQQPVPENTTRSGQDEWMAKLRSSPYAQFYANYGDIGKENAPADGA